jgi:UPF0755 protein
LLVKLGAAGFLVASLLAGWLWSLHHAALDRPLRVGEQPAILLVEPGASLAGVGDDLVERGLLENTFFWVWHARWKGLAAKIKAGEYRIQPETTPRELLHDLVAGKVMQHSLTLVEGWSFKQMMNAVAANSVLVHTLEGASAAQVMTQMGVPGEDPEGRFFPDTYHFPRGTSDVDILQRAYRTMEERLQREWSQRTDSLPYRNPYEALILASIVEKETGEPSERREIAGVYVRRLRQGMRLESDPTVIYGLGDAFDGNLTRRDLQRVTPYNTYRTKGLPPTPIAMPGGAAIHAALNPAPGDALFFVARGDGTHYFSATLSEHRQAVAKYQLRRRSSGNGTAR